MPHFFENVEVRLLLALKESDHREMFAKQIEEEHGVPASSVLRVRKDLEEIGLTKSEKKRKTPDYQDKKINTRIDAEYIRLTKKGKKIAKKLREIKNILN